MKSAIKRVMGQLGGKPQRPDASKETWPNRTDATTVTAPTILIFTPPNSGSTAISKFLTGQPEIDTFEDKKNEMQWMIPGLCGADRWWPEMLLNRHSIAGTANAEVARRSTGDSPPRYFVEKSPPNMVRAEALLDIFPNHHLLVNNRDPFANIASIIGRHGARSYGAFSRADMVEYMARMWLYRSRFLRAIATDYDVPIVTYEAFCANPAIVIDALGIELAAPAEEVTVSIKDYADQGIVNMNDRQIAKLEDTDCDAIARVLSSDIETVEVFGYTATRTAN